MYRFRKELREELLDGRKVKWVADKVGKSRITIYNILNNVNYTPKTTAYCIVKACNEKNEIADFFESIGDV